MSTTASPPHPLSLAPPFSALHLRLLRTLYPLPLPPATPRTAPMTVLCLGLPRTSTESLALALTTLGHGPVHHGWNNNADPRACATWCAFSAFKRANPGKLVPRADLESVLGGASALADFPMSAFWEDLVAAYPEARVVVNRRGEGKVERGEGRGGAQGEKWAISEEETGAWRESMWNSFVGIAEGRVVEWKRRLLGLAGYFEAEAAWVKINYSWVYRPYWNYNFLQNAESTYRRHYTEVEEATKGREILHWCVDDGWEPLCAFLGVPVPNEPFPDSNKGANFDARVMKLYEGRFKRAFRNVAMILVAVLAAMVALVTSRFI